MIVGRTFSILGTLRQAAFRASAVCKAWRAVTHRLYFQENWRAGTVIQQPAQLVTLCPQQHSGSGHIKCYIRRTRLSSGLSRRIYKFELFQGVDYQTHGSIDKYLMAAVQDGKQGYTMYLDRACSSKPIAQLLTNLMRTSYRLTAADMKLMRVSYKLRVRGMMLPRSRSSSSNSDGDRPKEVWLHQVGDSGQLVAAGGGGADLHLLQNKPPHWNQALRCWCLNFRGRFGKVDRNVFILDYDPVLGPLEVGGCTASWGKEQGGDCISLSCALIALA
eukprot:gene7611-7813_t